jgi:hypothetical protein
MPEFDELFRDVAKLRGSVLLVQVWLNEIGKTLAAFTGGTTPASAEDLGKLLSTIDRKKVKAAVGLPAQLKKHLLQAQAIVGELTALPKVGQSLVGKLKEIGPRAADAALKTPARMASLPDAVQSTVTQTDETLKKAAEILAPLKQALAVLQPLAG